MEKYFNAAEQITEKAIVVPECKDRAFKRGHVLDGDDDNGDGGGSVLLGVTGSEAAMVEHEFAKGWRLSFSRARLRPTIRARTGANVACDLMSKAIAPR